MKVSWLVCLIATSSSFICGDSLETRFDAVISLAKHFRTPYCVIGKPEAREPVGLISSKVYPPKKKLFASVLSFGEISRFISEDSIPKQGQRTIIILTMENGTLENLSQLSNEKSLSAAIWVLFSNSYFRPELFRNIYMPLNCEFIFAFQTDSMVSLKEIYQIKKGGRLETHDFGYWTKENGLVVTDTHFYARRSDLKGHRLKGVINHNPPYVSIEKDGTGSRMFKGYLYEIWHELEHRLNFRTEFQENLFDKNWEEVLKAEEVDFALARTSVVSSAVDYMDFSQPIHEAKFYMFGHRPGSELDWDSYLKPFSPNTWFVTIAWMLFSSLALSLLYRKAWDLSASEREANYYIFTFSESLLTVFRAICMQGSDITPRSNSCRFFFLSIYLTALVITSAFSAALFSLLTIPKPRSPFDSLEEVLSNNKFKIAIPSDFHFRKLVEDFSGTLSLSNQLKLLEKLAESKDTPPAMPQEKLVHVCEDKFYIFMFGLPEMLYLLQNASAACRDKVVPSGSPLFTEYIAFGFKKKNPYKELINFHLIRMKNDGILNRLLLNYWPPRIPTVQATWVRVTLSDISPILYMFALGAVLGTAFLYMEKLILNLKKKRKNKGKDFFRNYTSRFMLHQQMFSTGLPKTGFSDWGFYYKINYKN